MMHSNNNNHHNVTNERRHMATIGVTSRSAPNLHTIGSQHVPRRPHHYQRHRHEQELFMRNYILPQSRETNIGASNGINNGTSNGTRNGTRNGTNNHSINNHHENNHQAPISPSSILLQQLHHFQSRPPRPGRPKYAAVQEFTYGCTLYLLCVFLPRLPRIFYAIYVQLYYHVLACIANNSILYYVRWIAEYCILCWYLICHSVVVLLWGSGTADNDDAGAAVGGGRDGGGPHSSGLQHDRMSASSPPIISYFLHKASKYLFSSSHASLWDHFHQSTSTSAPSTSSSSSPSFANPFYWGFARSSSSAGITMLLRDIQFITMLAVTLAVIRVWLVHMLVPEYLAPRRLEALTRCKSTHLLSSSSYRFGNRRRKSGQMMEGEEHQLHEDSALGNYRRNTTRSTDEESGYYDRILNWSYDQWYRLRPSVRRALGHEPTTRYNNLISISPPSSPSNNRNIAFPIHHQTHTYTTTHHFFSAPRHATATFRLLYTSTSCLSALILFHAAEFWPRHVLGTHPLANTQHCWDLSGSVVALGYLDGDYDLRNGGLRYFFLAQSAYQLHSLCFHFVSMILLLLYGGTNTTANDGAIQRTNYIIRKEGFSPTSDNHRRKQQQQQQQQQHLRSIRLLSMKTSMQSYLRPMLEHVIVLALLIGSYLFSGLRRLGAVGIFTLEVSSVFLQLLQVCMYAPENSWFRKPHVVIFVHRFLTIPTFVYCRFFVLPFVVWYSAAFESQEWLEQIEKVFSPGWGEQIYFLFNGLLFLIFALNLVLFRRLLFHPHLRQIVQQSGRR